MGCDTRGRIKGYISHEDICNFIHQKYDKNVKNGVSKKIYCQISKCDFDFKINEHSQDMNNWYITSGFICFKYHDICTSIFYDYSNLNTLENLEYYSSKGLRELVETETTYISMRCCNESVKIIKEIVAHFGGGWVDNDDCDTEDYYPISVDVDGNIEPVRYVTMDEVRKIFGNNVVIKDR